MSRLLVIKFVIGLFLVLVMSGGHIRADDNTAARMPAQVAETFWSAVIAKDDDAAIALTDAASDADKQNVRAIVAQYRSATKLVDLLKEKFHASEDEVVQSGAGADFAWFKSVLIGFQNEPVEKITDATAKVTSERPTGNYTIQLVKKDGRWLVNANWFPERPATVSAAASDYVAKRTNQDWFKSLKQVGDRWFLERDIRKLEGTWRVTSAFGQPLADDAPGARFIFYREPNSDSTLLCTWADDRGPNAGKPTMSLIGPLSGRTVSFDRGVAVVDFAGDGRTEEFTVVGDWDNLNIHTDDPMNMTATRTTTSATQPSRNNNHPRPPEPDVVNDIIRNMKADEPTPYNPRP
jgi:hypothetical protein